MGTSLTRRSFVAGSAAAVAVGALAGAAMAVEPPEAWDAEADVLVIGGGGSGCAAALSAAENGAGVVLIEAGNYLGGVSRLCVGSFTTPCTQLQRDLGIEDSIETYIEDASALIGPANIENAGDDWKLFIVQAHEGGKSVDWLVEHGVEFVGPLAYPHHTNDRMHMLYPNSQAWPFVMEPELESYGVQIFKGTKCIAIVQDADGRAVGCKAVGPDGAELFFGGSKGVVYAAGSIDNAKDWKRKVVSNAMADIDPANPFTDGSGIKAMAGIGVDITNWISPQSVGMRTMGPGPDVSSIFKQAWMPYSIPQAGAILVNADGARFVNELDTSANIIMASNKQPGRMCWMIFDEAVASNFQTFPDMVVSSCPTVGWGTVDDFVANGGIVKADTIEELADKIGVDAGGLAATVEAWNAECAAGGPDEFGRATFGLEEAGTLGAGIVQAPFYCHGPHHGEVLHGTVSCAVSTDFEALDIFGEPIPGLYAVGVGGHGKSPMGGGGHGGNMTYTFTSGRLCGKAIATGESQTKAILDAYFGEDAAATEEQTTDAATYADGTYTGSGRGMGGFIDVTVEISGGAISVTDISPNNETKGIGGYEAIEDGTFADQVEAAQGAGIDGIAGATLTSSAIRDAVAAALAQAAR